MTFLVCKKTELWCVRMCVHTHVSERLKLELNLRYCYIEVVLRKLKRMERLHSETEKNCGCAWGGGKGIRVNLLEITKERSLSLGRLSTPCDVILFPILKNIDHFQNVLFKPLLIILKMVFHSIAHGTQFPFSFFSSFFPSCLSAYSVATCLPQSLRMEAMAHRKMTWFMH